jgi:hypothetical protein
MTFDFSNVYTLPTETNPLNDRNSSYSNIVKSFTGAAEVDLNMLRKQFKTKNKSTVNKIPKKDQPGKRFII